MLVTLSRMRFTLAALCILVVASALCFATVRSLGRVALPVWLFPAGMALGVAVTWSILGPTITASRMGGSFGGGLGLGLAGFMAGFLPPPPGTAYMWFPTGGLGMAVSLVGIYGAFGCLPGVFFGNVCSRLLQRISASHSFAGHEQSAAIVGGFVLALFASAVFWQLG